jgi:hypothetical protein
LFIQRQQRKIREFTYVFESDAYQSPDLTILSNQVAKGGITEIAYQQEPSTVVWGVKADGQLVGMTYLRDQQVIAWHRHKIGGVTDAATITVTDYANIAVGTELTLTKSDGTTVTFTSEASSGAAPAETLGWRPNESQDTTADNIFTAVNAHADFTVANPAANVVTVVESARAGAGFLSISSSDTTRLAVTNEDIAKVESLSVIPSTTSGEDELWIIVQRKINGTTRRFIEFIEARFDIDEGRSQDTAFFVDSGLGYSGTASASVSGLDHLEGQAVQILGNGDVYPNQNISSGDISSLSPTVTAAQVGLAYDSTVKTLRPEAGSEDGTAQGKTKRVFEVTIRFLATLGAKAGPSTTSLDEIQFRTGSHPMDSAPPLFSGDKTIQFRGGWGTEGQIVVQQQQPLPMHLTAIITRLVTQDG